MSDVTKIVLPFAIRADRLEEPKPFPQRGCLVPACAVRASSRFVCCSVSCCVPLGRVATPERVAGAARATVDRRPLRLGAAPLQEMLEVVRRAYEDWKAIDIDCSPDLSGALSLASSQDVAPGERGGEGRPSAIRRSLQRSVLGDVVRRVIAAMHR